MNFLRDSDACAIAKLKIRGGWMGVWWVSQRDLIFNSRAKVRLLAIGSSNLFVKPCILRYVTFV